MDSVQPGVGDDDDEDLSLARGLADVHAAAVREQVQASNRLLATAALMVARVNTILTSTDEDEIRANVRRLLINPKSDSFGSIMDVATKVTNAAVAMKRRALGMDNVRAGTEPSDEGLLPQKVRMVLDQLDPGALMQVREAALRVSRLRPDEIVSDNSEEME